MKKFTLLLLSAVASLQIHAQQWVSCNNPQGAHVQDMEEFSGNIWIGTHSGGVYRSADNGQTWQSANNGLINDDFQMDVNCLQPMGSKLLAGTAIGLFLRADATSPWMPTSLSMVQVNSMTQHGSFVMAGLYGVVARSTDGQTWTSLAGTGLPPANTFACQYLVSVQGTLVLGILQQNNGLYKSTTNGDSWTPISLPAGVPAGTSADFLKVIGDRLYTHFYNYGIFYSDDIGQT